MATNEKKSSTVPLSWKEVFFTNCPMVAAKELLEERWQEVTTAKLPEPTNLRLG